MTARGDGSGGPPAPGHMRSLRGGPGWSDPATPWSVTPGGVCPVLLPELQLHGQTHPRVIYSFPHVPAQKQASHSRPFPCLSPHQPQALLFADEVVR